METRFAQQMKKGVLEMAVLQQLARAPDHGYALLLRLRQESGGLLDLKEGTLYPILYRLEDDGRIVSAWTAEGGSAARSRATPKKIYTITESGRALLAQEKAAWRQFAACIEEMLAQPEEEE